MDWMTQEEIKKAGSGTELDAARCSGKHWGQLRDASSKEMVKGYEDAVDIAGDYCALCSYKNVNNNSCVDCCLPKCDGEGVYKEARNAFFEWENNRRSRELLGKFQDRAADMCDLIDKAIEKLEEEKEKEPKLRHGDYGYDSQGQCCMQIKIDSSDSLKDCDQYRVFDTQPGISEHGNDVFRVETRLGNIFDDLKRNSEDLHGFTHDRTKFSIDTEGRLKIDGLYGASFWVMEDPELIHQMLGQLIATNKRDRKNLKCK